MAATPAVLTNALCCLCCEREDSTGCLIVALKPVESCTQWAVPMQLLVERRVCSTDSGWEDHCLYPDAQREEQVRSAR